MDRMLEGKVAVIHGAGSQIAGAVARAFATEGARLFLSNRDPSKAAALGQDLGVTVKGLDVTDDAAVDDYVDDVVRQAGRIDISFNLIGIGDVQQPLLEISPDDFMQPIVTAMRTQFLTIRAAARHMVRQKAGVVLMFGGGGPQTYPGLGGFKVALDAMESLRRQWASELGSQGVRLVTLKTGGIPETLPEGLAARGAIAESIVSASPMHRVATLADVGAVATFVASDKARTITDTWINIGCGSMPE